MEELNKTQPQLQNTFDKQFWATMLLCLGAIIAFVGILFLIFTLTGLMKAYWSFALLGVGGAIIVGSIWMQMSIINGKSKHEKDLEEWKEINKNKIESLNGEMAEIAQKAAAVIRGYHTSSTASLSEFGSEESADTASVSSTDSAPVYGNDSADK